MYSILPPTLIGPVRFSAFGPDVGDVVRVDRRQQAHDDDQQEEEAEDQRHPVAPQAPPGERCRDRPRAAPSWSPFGSGDR